MKLRPRSRTAEVGDRLVWQAASLLLSYPDDQFDERLDTVETLLSHLDKAVAGQLGATVAALRAAEAMTRAMNYVATFDLQRRNTMYLTYWTTGDTRNRGRAMLAFATAYREAGVAPPRNEAPDYLPVVLEFAAHVAPAAGRRLLAEHRIPIEVLCSALAEAQSPYEHVVTSVCETLPAATDQQVLRAQRLAAAGPPAESVGLQPFTLTVPPRRRGEVAGV